MAFLLERYGRKCFYCNDRFTKNNRPTVDHVIPRSFARFNGIPVELYNHWSNNVPACRACNFIKDSFCPPIEFVYHWLTELANNEHARRNVRELAELHARRTGFSIPPRPGHRVAPEDLLAFA
jgi:hypothetical protein